MIFIIGFFPKYFEMNILVKFEFGNIYILLEIEVLLIMDSMWIFKAN